MALITAAEARAQIPAISGTDEDTFIESLIAVVGLVFARWCAAPPLSTGLHSLESGTRIVYPYVDEEEDPRRLYLGLSSSFPVTSITEIVEDVDLDYTDSADVVTSTYYTLLKGDRGWEVRLKSTATKSAWSTTSQAIRVTIVAGWSTIPDQLKHAARIAVRSLYDYRQRQGMEGNELAQFAPDRVILTDDVKMILAEFRQASALLA